MGVDSNSQSQNKAQTSPTELIINSPILLLNFLLKVSPELIISRLIEREKGTSKSPYPIAPPEFFSVMKLNGMK
ncbi:MAG TPA: hypothetical protein DDX92_12675 [Flavobacteriales bacterium]|nr:hypothetical protein [Flavobacteriales bacterium]